MVHIGTRRDGSLLRLALGGEYCVQVYSIETIITSSLDAINVEWVVSVDTPRWDISAVVREWMKSSAIVQQLGLLSAAATAAATTIFKHRL